MKIWMILGNCGDYYCEGSHVIAIATTGEEAVRLCAEAIAATGAGIDGSTYKRWNEVDIQEAETGHALPCP